MSGMEKRIYKYTTVYDFQRSLFLGQIGKRDIAIVLSVLKLSSSLLANRFLRWLEILLEYIPLKLKRFQKSKVCN